MFSNLSKFIVVLLAANSARLVADEGWPKAVERAWLITEAKVVGEDEGDPAVVDNLLLLVGQRLYIAMDQNTANGNDYSEKPMLLEKGFRIEKVTHNEDSTIAVARHKEGQRKLILTPSKNNQYLLRITFTGNVAHKYTLHFALKELDQNTAKSRLKTILSVGELEGNTQMGPLNAWIAGD